jgi:release factor glutamine methyltransferase
VSTLLEVLQKSSAFLAERGVESHRLDAEILLAHGLGLRRIDLYLQHDRPLDPAELARLRPLVLERGRGVPVAYLTGEREFFDLAFRVSRDVLVPRPETEGLVEAALAALAGVDAPRFCDVGTGSGCVAISLLHRLPRARAVATDLSKAALLVARENAARHGVLDRLDLREGHLLEPLGHAPAWTDLDAIVSNPPYVVRGDPTLEPRVAAHEPALALYVEGQDPLSVARALARAAPAALRPGGLLAFEIGAGSGPAAVELVASLGYLEPAVDPDRAGIPRVVRGRRPART